MAAPVAGRGIVPETNQVGPFMKRGIVFLLLIAAALPSAAESRRRSVRPRPVPVFNAIDAVAGEAIADGVPGFVVAVGIGDRFLFERAYGLMNVRERTLVATDSIFQIASVTKQFTAAAIMKLVERGELIVDTDVRSIIPELHTGDGVVTIEHLLTHTSGLPNYIEATIDPHQPITHQELIEKMNSLPVRFRPGDEFEYNNGGYYLLGIVIERLSGISYAEFLEQELLHPLGLVETAYCGRPPAWPIPDGYVKLGPLPRAEFEAMDMSIPFAAGALCSTAEDLVRWARALEEGRAVRPDSYEAMTTSYRLNSGGQTGYGYGISLGMRNGISVLSHSGGIPGFSSFLMVIPESGFTIAVVANLFSTETGPAADIALKVAELFH